MILRHAFLAFLFLLLGAFDAGRKLEAKDHDGLADALALEKTMQEAIARAEPSIACILVSRSDEYGQFGYGPPAREAGELGDFNANDLLAPRRFQDVDLIRRLDLSDSTTVPESYGSGVVLDASGLILTNYHVVRDASKLYIKFPGGKGSYADIHAADWRSDLAVLRLRSRIAGLKALPQGNAGELKKGQFILSLANPYAAGFRDGSPSASWGIISNLRRRLVGNVREEDRNKPLQNYGTLLQLDARLNLGCSGGAVIDLKGRLVGLTSAQAAIAGGETPGGFAIPMDEDMWRIVERLKAGSEVEYGFMGVRIRQQDITGADGAYLEAVIPGSGAAQKDADGQPNLRTGDLVTSIDGIRVHNSDDLFGALGCKLAGQTVAVETIRANRPRKTSVKLAKLNTPGRNIYFNKPPAPGGVRVDYTSALFFRGGGGLNEGISPGVAISEIIPGSSAVSVQLKPGRIIFQVNGRVVNSPAEYYEEAGKAKGKLVLQVQKVEGGVETVELALP